MAGKSLNKDERIKSRKLVEELFANPISFKVYPFKIFYKFVQFEEDVAIKISVSVPKRKFKQAVKRNKIKRITKEAYRLNKQEAYDKLKSQNLQLALMFVYIGNDIPEYTFIEGKIKEILSRLDTIEK